MSRRGREVVTKGGKGGGEGGTEGEKEEGMGGGGREEGRGS